MKEQFENLMQEVEELFEKVKMDAGKFINNNNKAAGTRVRTGSIALSKVLKSLRDKVSEIKNS